MAATPGARRVGRVNVLLFDDHACFGQSVAHALSAQADLDVSHCTTVATALEILQRQPIDVVLLDHDLGAERASQFLPVARQRGFSGRVLIVTAWVSDTEAKRQLRHGVAGVFAKDSSLEALAESIRLIQGGAIWLDRRNRNLTAPNGRANGSMHARAEPDHARAGGEHREVSAAQVLGIRAYSQVRDKVGCPC